MKYPLIKFVRYLPVIYRPQVNFLELYRNQLKKNDFCEIWIRNNF